MTACRDRVLSPYPFIHLTKIRALCNPGEAVHENTVFKGFKRARNKTEINWQGQPASFNEVRSLVGRLYKEPGVDLQALLCHKDAAITAIYLDGRILEWDLCRLRWKCFGKILGILC